MPRSLDLPLTNYRILYHLTMYLRHKRCLTNVFRWVPKTSLVSGTETRDGTFIIQYHLKLLLNEKQFQNFEQLKSDIVIFFYSQSSRYGK